MRYGVTLQAVAEPAEFVELARWIERLGYDDLWIGDSSLHCGDAYVYATLALQATSTLRVGTSVTNPLTRHTGITANAFRSLEQLGPGRVVCGTGVGEGPLIELGFSRAKLSTLVEHMDAMRRLWRGETVDAQVGRQRLVGSHLRSPSGPVPVFVSASGPRTLEAAGRHADGVLMLGGLFPEALGWSLEQLQRGRRRSTLEDFETACCLYGAVDDDEQAAVESARAIVAWLAKASPPAARAAGMADDLIDAVNANYRGREFQEARRAAAMVPDAIVQRVAFAGGRKYAEEKLAWLDSAGIDTVNLGPLAADPRPTIAAVAEIAGLRGRADGPAASAPPQMPDV